jgi:O-antigen/teichoic acid export membrane protein
LLKLITKNIKLTGISKLLWIAVRFSLLPFIITNVGKEQYGLYLLVLSLGTYLNMLDFGTAPTIIKYTAQLTSTNNKQKLYNILNTSIFINIILGILTALGFAISITFFEYFFSVPALHKSIITQILITASISSLIARPLMSFRHILRGMQRYDYIIKIESFCVFANAGTIFILLKNGYGIFSIFLSMILFENLNSLLSLFAVKKLMKNWNIKLISFSKQAFKTIYTYGPLVYLNEMITNFLTSIDKILVGIFLGLTSVTYYGIAGIFLFILRILSGIITEPIWPAIAYFEGQDNQKAQSEIFIRGTRLSLFVIAPLIAVLFIYSNSLIPLWMGKDFITSIIIARIFLLLSLAKTISIISQGILSAKGKHLLKNLLKVQTTNIIVSIISAIILVKIFGFIGIALGLALGQILIYTPFVLKLTLNNFNIPINKFYKLCLQKNIFAFIFTLTISYGCKYIFEPSNLFTCLISMGLIYLAAMLTLFLTIFPRKDKIYFINLITLKKAQVKL